MKLQETENKAIELEIVREKQLLELMQKNDQLFEENKRLIQEIDDHQNFRKELATLEMQLKENDKKLRSDLSC